MSSGCVYKRIPLGISISLLYYDKFMVCISVKGIVIFISAWALCVVRSTDSGNAKASKGGTATGGSRFFYVRSAAFICDAPC